MKKHNATERLKAILAIKDEKACGQALAKFCQSQADKLPLPGQEPLFDKAMWEAAQYLPLSKHDDSILKRVTDKLIGSKTSTVTVACLKLKDLLGASRDLALQTWQDLVSAMDWQQMVPAGALRGVAGQMVSLGTIQRQLNDANIQLNLGWLVDENHLRILLQARDNDDQAIPDVELKVNEVNRGTVYSRRTNEDGAVVAPDVQIGPGQYQIQVTWMDQIAETPYFVI